VRAWSPSGGRPRDESASGESGDESIAYFAEVYAKLDVTLTPS